MVEIYQKICPICHRAFETQYSAKLYCSQQCKVEHKKIVKRQYRLDNYTGIAPHKKARPTKWGVSPKRKKMYAPELFEEGFINPIMKGYCDGCQYRKSLAVSSEATFCGYILIEGHSREGMHQKSQRQAAGHPRHTAFYLWEGVA